MNNVIGHTFTLHSGCEYMYYYIHDIIRHLSPCTRHTCSEWILEHKFCMYIPQCTVHTQTYGQWTGIMYVIIYNYLVMYFFTNDTDIGHKQNKKYKTNEWRIGRPLCTRSRSLSRPMLPWVLRARAYLMLISDAGPHYYDSCSSCSRS